MISCNPGEKQTDALLEASPTALEIREEENYWRAVQKETAATRRELLEWANAAQSAVQQLQAQQPLWNATLEENESTPDLGPTLDVIQQIRHRPAQANGAGAGPTAGAGKPAGPRWPARTSLRLDVLYRLNKAQQDQDSRLFERDSLPLWQLSQRRQEGESNRHLPECFHPAAGHSRLCRADAGPPDLAGAVPVPLVVWRLPAAHRDPLYPADGCSTLR